MKSAMAVCGVMPHSFTVFAYALFSSFRSSDAPASIYVSEGDTAASVMDLDKDRTIVGNYMPDFTYGFGGKVWYKGIDLDFNFQGVYGNEILNLKSLY